MHDDSGWFVDDYKLWVFNQYVYGVVFWNECFYFGRHVDTDLVAHSRALIWSSVFPVDGDMATTKKAYSSRPADV